MIIFVIKMKYINWINPELADYMHSFFSEDFIKTDKEEFIKHWYGVEIMLDPYVPTLDKSEKLARAEYPSHANKYIRKYVHWDQIPTVDKLIRNHANFLHIPIETYHTKCELIVLMQFLDDYALCFVKHMLSTELVCAPPMHEFTGVQWSTYRTCDNSFEYMKYNPLCFVNLKSRLIKERNEDEHTLTIFVNANTVC